MLTSRILRKLKICVFFVGLLWIGDPPFESMKGQSADHKSRLGTWANEEARRRLEKEGLLEDPDDYNPIVGPYPNKERYHELVLGRK